MDKQFTLMKTRITGTDIEVLPLQNWDAISRQNVTSYHPFVKSKVYEAAVTAGEYMPPFSITKSEFEHISEGRGLWHIEILVHGKSQDQTRTLKGTASCSSEPDIQVNQKTGKKYDANDDWAEKAETKALGRALGMGGYGNVQGSSIASAEDIVAYKRRNGREDNDSMSQRVEYQEEKQSESNSSKDDKQQQKTEKQAKKPAEEKQRPQEKSILQMSNQEAIDSYWNVDTDLKAKAETDKAMPLKLDAAIKLRRHAAMYIQNASQEFRQQRMRLVLKKTKDLTELDNLPMTVSDLMSIELSQIEKLKEEICAIKID